MIMEERTNTIASRRSEQWKNFGYQPDAAMADGLMKDLLLELNGPTLYRRRPDPSAKRQRVLLGEPKPEHQQRLRALIQDWMATGPNLTQFLESHPEVQEFTGRFKLSFSPGPEERGYMLAPSEPSQSSSEHAFTFFLMLITNPEWTRLGGPCPECGDYFLKKRMAQKYCTRICSSAATATSAMKEKRHRSQQEKVSLANALVEVWVERRPRISWKPWVVHQAATRFTLHWLTRAINAGLVIPPGV